MNSEHKSHVQKVDGGPSNQNLASGFDQPAGRDDDIYTEKDKGTLIIASVLMAFGIFWTIASIRIPNLTMVGTLGPGFLPAWAAIVLTGISILLFVRTFGKIRRAKRFSKEGEALKPGWKMRVLGTFSALLVYVLLLPHLHFFINTFLISVVGLAVTGEPLKPRLLLVAGVISGALFAIFIFWLQIPLPGSRLGG